MNCKAQNPRISYSSLSLLRVNTNPPQLNLHVNILDAEKHLNIRRIRRDFEIEEDRRPRIFTLPAKRKEPESLQFRTRPPNWKAVNLSVTSQKKLLNRRYDVAEARSTPMRPCSSSQVKRSVALPQPVPCRISKTLENLKVKVGYSPSMMPPKSLEGWKKQKGLDKATKVFIIAGNYPALRAALLKRRWAENKDLNSTFFDLLWSRKPRLPVGLRDWQMFNHFERNFELCTKTHLAKNLEKLQKNTVNVAKFYPRSYKISDGLPNDFTDRFKAVYSVSLLKEFVYGGEDHPIEKAMTAVLVANRLAYSLESSLREEGTCFIMNLEWRLISSENSTEFAYLYKKLLITSRPSNKAEARTIAVTALERLAKVDEQFTISGDKNIWILKPGYKSRGRDIALFNRLDDIRSSTANSQCWVIQKYIENPLIIQNKKFDIRQWVFITDFDCLKVYIYNECYLRFSVEDWSISDIDNLYIHLTNNCISRKSKKFSHCEIRDCM